jgi:hypothetical protein
MADPVVPEAAATPRAPVETGTHAVATDHPAIAVVSLPIQRPNVHVVTVVGCKRK